MLSADLDLGWLRVFDAAARMGSLTRAAEELGLSQPAVSYQIRRIEEHLGAQLFQRMHGGSRLTEAGEILFRTIRPAVARIDDAARDIRRLKRAPVVRIYTDYGFAAFWLMPRVADFRRLHPEVEVHIIASQGLENALEGDADTAVLFGRRGDFPEGAALLIPERVVPVCSPGFLARFGPFPDAATLASAPLLHLDTIGEPRWLTWNSWLAAVGMERKPTRGDLGLNTYSFVIEAALAEQGIALGWLGLIDTYLASGMLVTVGPQVDRSDHGYWLVSNRAHDGVIGLLNEWLVEQSS